MGISRAITIFAAAIAMAGCSDAHTDASIQDLASSSAGSALPASAPATDSQTVAGKPDGPLNIAYQIIGKPVVGKPVTIELQVVSTIGSQPIELSYRINDASVMRLADAQLANARVSPVAGEAASRQRVNVVPMREGRVYLNVSASVATADGRMSTVTAIPIQVGNAPRELIENGARSTDANGEAIQVLPGNGS